MRVVTASPIALPAAPVIPAAPMALPAAPVIPAAPMVLPPTSAPTRVEEARTGFDRIFDFPALASGDSFRIVDGSTANGISVRGEARIEELSPTSARVWVKAGRFGFNREAVLEVRQLDPTTVQIRATRPDMPPKTGTGQIVAVRTNYSEFASEDGPVTGTARLQVNASGQFVVDMSGDLIDDEVNLHLVMEKRDA